MSTKTMAFDHYFIRQVSAEDVQGLFDMIDRNRARLEDFFAGTVAKTKTLEDTRTHVANILAKVEARTYFPFVVIDASTNNMMGFADIKSIDWSIPKAELGYFIDSAYEGKGISARALAMITAHAFEVFGFTKLLLRTHERNIGSRRIAEKNGFVVEGIIRKDYRTTRGEIVDLMYYGRIKES